MSERGLGRALSRVEGHAKVTGSAKYAADFAPPAHLHAVIVSSTIGLGRIAAIDTDRVAGMAGVVAILTHLNAPRLAYREHRGSVDPAIGERLHVLQDDRVRFFGQPVGVIVAATLEQAEHAAAALPIRYRAEQPQVRLESAERIVPEAALRPGSRVLADSARGDADAALREAAVRIDAVYEIPRENHNPIEPHATVAAWEGDRLTLWSKSQFVVNEAAQIAAVFGLPAEHVRVVSPYVGGAFGTTLRTWPHVALAALAARQVGRPVKLVLGRRQMFYATGHRPRSTQRVALGAREDGRLSAIVHEAVSETSRYEQYAEPVTTASTFLYACPAVRTRYRLAPLDAGTPGHMRGPGTASGVFALECAMDELAFELGLDPIELRKLNEPARNEHSGLPFSSRALLASYAAGAARFGWQRRDPRPRSMRDGALLIGWGTASALYPTLRGQARARARLLPDGSAEIEAAASDMGPGTYTSITQIAAEALGLETRQIRFRLGQSDFPATPPHGGSMTLASVGSAVRAACLAVRERAGGADYREIIARGGGNAIEAEATSGGGDEQNRFSMHAYGAVFIEVAVDPDLATVRVRRAVGAYGAGRIVNPKLARSQCIGGIVGGIGMALMEETRLDPRDGRPVDASLAEYLVPVNADVGSLEVLFVDEEDPHVNPLGVKGLGEVASVGVAPAIANAIFHATGRRIRELPVRVAALLE